MVDVKLHGIAEGRLGTGSMCYDLAMVTQSQML